MTVWTPPAHVSTGTASSADFNAQVLDNLQYLKDRLDTAALTSALNTNKASGSVSTSSSSFVGLSGGPTLTVTTGTTALVIVSAEAGTSGSVGFAVSGATSIAASLTTAVTAVGGQLQASRATLLTSLTPGSNTFTVQYSSFSGSVSFANRELIVVTFA